MSAELLRRAASLMRERAERGPDHPWTVDSDDQIIAAYSLGEVVIADYINETWTEHIASWHPTVALAVADWLSDALEAHLHVRVGNHPSYLKAVEVARAYLGEDA